MSYILDALQRAEAERVRGGVPTLHARPLAEQPLPHRLGTPLRWGLTLAMVALALAVAAAGWWMWPSAPAPAPAPTSKPTPQRKTTDVDEKLPAKPKASASASVVQPVEPARAKAKEAPAPLLSELPEATRRQIPAMAISGAVYSTNPAQRLLLVNGQVLTQGSQVAPDLTVVEIRSTHSEFNFRGTRFRMAH
jgi:general secretion pathway protein B